MNLKKQNKKSPELSINNFIRIQNIFLKKNWPIQSTFDEEVFENFCKMLANLDDDQIDLMISLTEKFLWIQESEYIKYFSLIFDNFINTYNFSLGKKIYICPLLPEEDFGKSKSSVFLLYLVKSHITAMQKKYPDFAITYADSPDTSNFDMIEKDNFTICLIDDFIGTGETAEKALNYFINKGIRKEMITVISLVGMKAGILYLTNKGYKTYANIVCDKGISSTENEAAIQIMEEIEKKIHVKDIFKFGYGSSESLVRMSRTPNNTFPVYWLQNKDNEFAPFPR